MPRCASRNKEFNLLISLVSLNNFRNHVRQPPIIATLRRGNPASVGEHITWYIGWTGAAWLRLQSESGTSSCASTRSRRSRGKLTKGGHRFHSWKPTVGMHFCTKKLRMLPCGLCFSRNVKRMTTPESKSWKGVYFKLFQVPIPPNKTTPSYEVHLYETQGAISSFPVLYLTDPCMTGVLNVEWWCYSYISYINQLMIKYHKIIKWWFGIRIRCP